MSDDGDVTELVSAILMAAADSDDEQFGKALHHAVNTSQGVIDAFNREVDRELRERLQRQGLRPTSLHRLATKNNFGAN